MFIKQKSASRAQKPAKKNLALIIVQYVTRYSCIIGDELELSGRLEY